jgi:hypothetical protein
MFDGHDVDAAVLVVDAASSEPAAERYAAGPGQPLAQPVIG